MSEVIVANHSKSVRHVLVIEDSPMLLNHMARSIDALLNIHCDKAATEKEAKAMIRRKRYDLIIADIFLPDSTGNFIGSLIRNNHSLVLITGSEEDELRAQLTALPIVDYVVKYDAENLLQSLSKIIERYSRNHRTLVGICDDSVVMRRSISQILETQNLSYIEFSNGKEVMDYLEGEERRLDLLLTDYEMPLMNGLDLVRKIRATISPLELPVISLSASNTPHLVSKFLKAGANDYIHKPYEREEFLTRLNHMLDLIYAQKERDDLLQKLRDASMKDFLTGLYNRHYFFTNIEHIIAKAQRDEIPYGILILDIDHFKKINDTFGHNAGDIAIAHTAEIVQKNIRKGDYAFRWGGEEFVVVLTSIKKWELSNVCEKIRHAIEEIPVVISEALTFHMTASIGAASSLSNDYQQVLSDADGHLYRAKKEGRNRVFFSETELEG